MIEENPTLNQTYLLLPPSKIKKDNDNNIGGLVGKLAEAEQKYSIGLDWREGRKSQSQWINN